MFSQDPIAKIETVWVLSNLERKAPKAIND